MIFLMKWGSVGQSSLPARAKARDFASWKTDSRLKHFDSVFRVLASGFRFPVSGFRFPISGFRVPVTDFRFPVSGLRIPVSGFRVPGSRFLTPIMVVHGCSEFIVNRSSSGFMVQSVLQGSCWFMVQYLKEDFRLQVFSWICFPCPLSIPSVSFRLFTKIRVDIRNTAVSVTPVILLNISANLKFSTKI